MLVSVICVLFMYMSYVAVRFDDEVARMIAVFIPDLNSMVNLCDGKS
jgi:hypothetical protein